jgi:hypothetical protein
VEGRRDHGPRTCGSGYLRWYLAQEGDGLTHYLIVATAIVSAAAAWTMQDWRYSGQIAQLERDHITATAQRQADHIKALEIAHEQTIRHQQQAQQAQDDASVRMAGADAALRRNRGELERLRDAAARSRPSAVCLPDASTTATAQTADPVGDVLGECATAIVDVARAADGHVSDVKMMRDASVKP